MQHLDVELLFPASPSGPSTAAAPPPESALQRRRGRVRRAELIIEQAALNRSLAAVLTRLRGTGSSALPFDLIRVRIDGSASVAGFTVLFRFPPQSSPSSETAKVSPHEHGPLWGTARVAARRPPAGTYDLILGISEVRQYGRSRLAAPLVGHALLQALGTALLSYPPGELPAVTLNSGAPPLGLHLLGTPALSELRMELLHDALLEILPRAGYRAADPTTAPLFEIQSLPGQLVLRYAADGQRGGLSYADLDDRPRSNPIIEPAALLLGAPLPEALRLGDYLLHAGDVGGALAIYRYVTGSQPLATVARQRYLQILASAPERHKTATELADAELVASPSSPVALIALAGIYEERNDLEAAARRYLALGADVHAHQLERAAAFFAASRCLNRSDPGAARSARAAAESLLPPGGPEEPLLEAVQSAGQEAARPAVVATAPVGVVPDALRAQLARTSGPARVRMLDEALQKFTGDPELLRLRAELDEPASALQRIEAALGAAAPPPAGEKSLSEDRRRLLLYAAQLAVQLGEIDRSRDLLSQAGPHSDALRARVQLDWPELLQAEPGSPSDLLPVLRELQASGDARAEELRGLARLLTVRGQYAEALAVQEQAGADPDELLASLEAAGRSRELLAALAVHATHRPDAGCLLYQQAASIAEYQLADRPMAASYWQIAAELASKEPPLDDAPLFWFHAGRLWHDSGDSTRAYAALGRSVESGGANLPRLTPLLAELAYTLGDLEAAALYYRRALDAGQVPVNGRAQAYLRIAESARQLSDAQMEEQALERAVEFGGGAQAWPKLCALFRLQDDRERLGAALLAWADYEPPHQRISLLHEAASLVSPLLLPRIDEELMLLEGDDETVRDRLVARLTESGDRRELLEALRRDVERSHGPRRRQRAEELIELALKLAIYPAAVEGWTAILHDTDVASGLSTEELERALDFWNTLLRARAAAQLAPAELEALRQLLMGVGRLPERLDLLESELTSLARESEFVRRERMLPIVRRAAQIAELLGYQETAAQYYLQLCAGAPADRELLSRVRRVLRGLAQVGRAETAVALVDGELRRLGASAPQAIGLRVALAELLMFLERVPEALAQLELVLLRTAEFGPSHALLGMLLSTSTVPEEVQRGLRHLLIAAYAADVEPHEAGECALMAADMLASAGIAEPVELTTLIAAGNEDPGYAERAVIGTFVAVPTDFLEPEMAAGSGSLGSAATPPTLPQMLGPVELLLRAATLLPGDPRPLEGLLGLTWSRGDYAQAADCCDRLLSLPSVASDPLERARISIEKAHVLLRLERNAEAEALLRQALIDVPSSPTALRALRRLLADRGELDEALTLIERELKLAVTAENPGQGNGFAEQHAQLWCDVGHLQAARGQHAAALEAWRRAGQLGSAAGWLSLAEGLAEQGEWLGAADAAGRGASLSSVNERAARLLRAAELALRADDELRARDYLAQAAVLGGESGSVAEERLRELDGGPEPEKRRRTLERRLKHTGPGLERLELLRRLVLLCSELYERTAMVSYANSLIREAPSDALALCALAEDAIEHGQPDLAASRLAQAGAIPQNYPRATRLLACLGEVNERKGNPAAAEVAFKRLLEAGERLGEVPSIDLAIEGLARLREEQGDAAEALRWLRRRLPYLPPEAVSARATLRLRMSDLAMSLGDLDEARQQLLAVLEESPAQRSALVKLLDVYRQVEQPSEALRVLDRLLDLTMTPGERAEWLFARGELCEKQLGDLEEAERLYRQVLTQWPAHARALRRLIVLAVGRGDRAAVAAAVAALNKAGSPLADAQIPAALGLLLPVDARPGQTAAEPEPQSLFGDPQTFLKTATPAELAAVLCSIGLGGAGLSRLDGPLAGTLRALGGNAGPLLAALRQRMRDAGGFEPQAAGVLARLCELRGIGAQSLYLAALAFLEPGGYADEKLDEMGALPVPEVALEAALLAVRPMPPEQAPWLVVFGLLGRHVLGLHVSPLPPNSAAGSELEEQLSELGRTLGLAGLEVALVDQLDGDPAVCDPTRPPRLRLLRALVKDGAQARFAALRALHLLRAGMPLCEWGGAEGMAALVRAAAALWLEGTPGIPRVEDIQELLPREREWLGTLRALALHPEHAPGVVYEARAEVEAIQSCLSLLDGQPNRLIELWPELLASARLEASARALGQLGDLRAALRALDRGAGAADAPAERRRRLAALRQGPLASLLAIAACLYE